MDERLRFVARLLDGQSMSRVCREFGISRPTGYKIFNRYKDIGYQGLLDRSRRPYRHANQLPFQIESAIVRLRNEHPSWSPDNRHIVFQSSRTGTAQIWSMLADGTKPRQLTLQGENSEPVWSSR